MALENPSLNCFRKFKRLQLTFQVVYFFYNHIAIYLCFIGTSCFHALPFPLLGFSASSCPASTNWLFNATRPEGQASLRPLAQPGLPRRAARCPSYLSSLTSPSRR